MLGGIFTKSSSGIFGGSSLGSLGGVGLSGPVEDQISQCVKNRLASPCAFSESLRADLIAETGQDPCPKMSEAQIRADCTKFANTAVECAKKCDVNRPDTPEWAQCVQKCHGYSPVDYTAQKLGCEAAGKVYSWLEGGCVSKAKFNGCPAGTMYASYPDGSEKCIGYVTDLTKSTCPAGTKLQTVPKAGGGSGQACVSPVVPGVAPVRPGPAPAPGPVTVPGVVPTSQAGFSTTGVLLFAGGAAVLALYLYKKDKKKKPPVDVPKLMSRANRRGWR